MIFIELLFARCDVAWILAVVEPKYLSLSPGSPFVSCQNLDKALNLLAHQMYLGKVKISNPK